MDNTDPILTWWIKELDSTRMPKKYVKIQNLCWWERQSETIIKTWENQGVITYYVGANRTEGIGATHIEMSAVQPQENFDVIEAISLGRGKKRRSKCEIYEILTSESTFSWKLQTCTWHTDSHDNRIQTHQNLFDWNSSQTLLKKISQRCTTEPVGLPETHGPELYTAAQRLPWFVALGYNSWHDNKVKEAIPRRACTLDASICNWWKRFVNTRQCSFYLLMTPVTQIRENSTKRTHSLHKKIHALHMVITDLLALRCFHSFWWKAKGERCFSPPGFFL